VRIFVKARFPFLISIPHGGDFIPEEVKRRIRLSQSEIYQNSDPCTRKIYAFGDTVAAVCEGEVSRVVIDLNRAPYDRPPANPDGVVKTVTPDGIEIYREGLFPDAVLIQLLLKTYYYPYHRRLNEYLESGSIQLALDCHSMTPYAPRLYPNAGSRRPLVCLSNRGDSQGMPSRRGSLVTCPPEWIRKLSRSFAQEFRGEGEVRMNDPFPGGFIARSHYRQKRVPWIQVEINRNLYEPEEYPDAERCEIDERRVLGLRARIVSVLDEFWIEIGSD
jgi:N-formylglutamate deformylase